MHEKKEIEGRASGELACASVFGPESKTLTGPHLGKQIVYHNIQVRFSDILLYFNPLNFPSELQMYIQL